MSFPEVTLPAVDLPTFELPKFDLPKFDLPKFDLSALDTTAVAKLRDRAHDAVHQARSTADGARNAAEHTVVLVREAVGI